MLFEVHFLFGTDPPHGGGSFAKRKINSSQAIISMMLFPNDWYKAPIIKLGKHEKLKNLFQTDNKYISYQDFFDSSLLIQFPLKKEQNSDSWTKS